MIFLRGSCSNILAGILKRPANIFGLILVSWLVTLSLLAEAENVPSAVPIAKSDAAKVNSERLGQIYRVVQATPAQAPQVVQQALDSEAEFPITDAGQVVGAAIAGLGDRLNPVNLASVVRVAVAKRPAAILEIVRVAVRQTPSKYHPHIVAAAISALRDPFKLVIIRVVELMAPRQFVVVTPGALGYEESPEGEILAEVVVEVAFQNGPGGNLAELTAAADSVLQNAMRPVGFDPLNRDAYINKLVPPKPTPIPTPPSVSP